MSIERRVVSSVLRLIRAYESPMEEWTQSHGIVWLSTKAFELIQSEGVLPERGDRGVRCTIEQVSDVQFLYGWDRGHPKVRAVDRDGPYWRVVRRGSEVRGGNPRVLVYERLGPSVEDDEYFYQTVMGMLTPESEVFVIPGQ